MSAKHTPPEMLRGLTDAQRVLRPYCQDCGWRRGGPDSWDGARCKCGVSSPTFSQLLALAEHHEERAEELDALDMGAGDCEVAAAYHATRASEIRAAIAKAIGAENSDGFDKAIKRADKQAGA
jgi:hypothetical protein